MTEQERIIEILTPLVAPLGYEIVHAEVLNQRNKVLRVFIDHLERETSGIEPGIGIEDCVRVTKALDEPLDHIQDIETIFKGAYELEVSSPGIDRPLRQMRDFERFSGQDVRIHLFRPLTAEEMGNAKYQERNPKQKNFLGTLKGVQNGKILIVVNASGSTKEKSQNTNRLEEVTIPLPLISKANLEPQFDLLGKEIPERK